MPKTARLIEIQSEAEIPDFTNEDEEHEFWSTHSLGEGYFRENPPVELDWLPAPRPDPIPVQLDRDVLGRLKALARKKRKPYPQLLKEFVTERLYEEEKREGIIPS